MSTVILIDPPTPYDDQINLGPVYLGSYLESIGHKVRIVDMNFHQKDNYERLWEAIQESWPDIIGISVMTYFAFGEVKKLLKYIKTVCDAQIVVGGASPTIFAVEMMKDNPEIDWAVVGEGEHTLGEICEAVQDKAFEYIEGAAWRDGKNIVFVEQRPPIKDLDTLPMLNFGLIDLVEKYGFTYYRNTLVMSTSRGCPYACSFCLSSVLCQRKWRPFSAKRVVDEIEAAHNKYNLTRVSFEDDNFVMLPDRVIDICRMIKERNLPVKLCLEGGVRADRLTRESFEALRSIGIEDAFLAVESGSPKVFDQIGKGETLRDIEVALRLLDKANIDLQVYMILGLPGDTHETFLESMAFLKKYHVKGRWHFAFPFENTKMFDYVKEHGRFLKDCTGYDINIRNEITTYGTMPLVFDTPEYPSKQRVKDYYTAVMDSGALFYVFGRFKNHALNALRCLFLVAWHKPTKLPAYFNYLSKLARNYMRLKV